MGGIFYGIFSRLPFTRFASESFLVFDIGTFSIKALIVERSRSKLDISAYANRPISIDVYTDKGLNISSIASACKLAMKDLRAAGGRRKSFPKKVIFGIGGGFLYGRTLTQNYIRENPAEEINAGEFTNIIQKVQQRIYEQIRRDFSKDTARSELEVCVINSALQEVKIDGYQIVNPIGFKGKEIVISLFNSYALKSYVNIFEELAGELKLEIISIVSEPHAVFSIINENNPSKTDAVLIDMGGSTTEIALIRKGKLEDIKAIAIGGTSFTKSIAGNLKFSQGEAENIKQRFALGGVSDSVTRKLEKIIANDMKLFLNALRLVLSDLSQVVLLPSQIYIYGGGASMPIVEQTLKQKWWRENLSFFSHPNIILLSSPVRDWNSCPDILKSVLWIAPIALARFCMRQGEKQDDISKILRRTLRLIQN